LQLGLFGGHGRARHSSSQSSMPGAVRRAGYLEGETSWSIRECCSLLLCPNFDTPRRSPRRSRYVAKKQPLTRSQTKADKKKCSGSCKLGKQPLKLINIRVG
jgi:hypothetical protein